MTTKESRLEPPKPVDAYCLVAVDGMFYDYETDDVDELDSARFTQPRVEETIGIWGEVE